MIRANRSQLLLHSPSSGRHKSAIIAHPRRGARVSRAIAFRPSANSALRGTESPLDTAIKDTSGGHRARGEALPSSSHFEFQWSSLKWYAHPIWPGKIYLADALLKLEGLFNSLVRTLLARTPRLARQPDSLQKRIARSLVNREHRGIFGPRPNSPYVRTYTGSHRIAWMRARVIYRWHERGCTGKSIWSEWRRGRDDGDGEREREGNMLIKQKIFSRLER